MGVEMNKIELEVNIPTFVKRESGRQFKEHVLRLTRNSENKTLSLFLEQYSRLASAVRQPVSVLYSDLLRYLDTSNSANSDDQVNLLPPDLNLEDSVNTFFTRLFPEVGSVPTINLACRWGSVPTSVSMSVFVSPGDHARDTAIWRRPQSSRSRALARSISRSAEAARTLFQALELGAEVLSSTDSLLMSEPGGTDHCHEALLRMSYCSRCRGLTSRAKPCAGYCLNVMRGCLTQHAAELDLPWSGFVEATERLAAAVKGRDSGAAPLDVQRVLGELDSRVSEAIMLALENGPSLERKGAYTTVPWGEGWHFRADTDTTVLWGEGWHFRADTDTTVLYYGVRDGTLEQTLILLYCGVRDGTLEQTLTLLYCGVRDGTLEQTLTLLYCRVRDGTLEQTLTLLCRGVRDGNLEQTLTLLYYVVRDDTLAQTLILLYCGVRDGTLEQTLTLLYYGVRDGTLEQTLTLLYCGVRDGTLEQTLTLLYYGVRDDTLEQTLILLYCGVRDGTLEQTLILLYCGVRDGTLEQTLILLYLDGTLEQTLTLLYCGVRDGTLEQTLTLLYCGVRDGTPDQVVTLLYCGVRDGTPDQVVTLLYCGVKDGTPDQVVTLLYCGVKDGTPDQVVTLLYCRLANALLVLSSTAEDGEIEVRISVG
uniref:Uncharacterized protein n=1 Tax=Timema genevievae TaxID=629358 RepID=A0A7R9K7P6_TIMGE|nr:unnamed protein product [Timema genevievae]